MNKIITSESGGLSGIHFPTKENESGERSAQWGDRQVKDMTNIHPEEEVFLLGNLYALKGLATHLFRGLVGLVAGLCTLGGAWVGSQKVRQMTADLTKIPADLLKSLPVVGNLFAAHCNKIAFNEVSTKEEAQAKEAAEKARRKDQFDTSKKQLEADFFYRDLSSKLPIFRSAEEPFPELRRLAFAHRKDQTTNPQLEENLKKLVSQIPDEKLYIFLVNERGSLEQSTPSALWKVCKEVYVEKLATQLLDMRMSVDQSQPNEAETGMLTMYFSLLSLEELTQMLSPLISDNSSSIGKDLFLNNKLDSPPIPSTIWRPAILNHLKELYPDGTEKDYLAALPKDYLEKLSKNKGLDPLREKGFKQEDILRAWFHQSPLNQLLPLRNLVVVSSSSDLPFQITEGAPEISSEIWMDAVNQELVARYPDRNNYLAELPRDYLEVLFKDGGTDYVSGMQFTKDEILTALSSSMGGTESLKDTDWEANLREK